MNIEPKTTTTKKLGRAISAHVSDAYKLGQDFTAVWSQSQRQIQPNIEIYGCSEEEREKIIYFWII